MKIGRRITQQRQRRFMDITLDTRKIYITSILLRKRTSTSIIITTLLIIIYRPTISRGTFTHQTRGTITILTRLPALRLRMSFLENKCLNIFLMISIDTCTRRTIRRRFLIMVSGLSRRLRSVTRFFLII